jgi:hypothetical protein
MYILAMIAGYIGSKLMLHNFGEQGVYIGMLILTAMIIVGVYIINHALKISLSFGCYNY